MWLRKGGKGILGFLFLDVETYICHFFSENLEFCLWLAFVIFSKLSFNYFRSRTMSSILFLKGFVAPLWGMCWN